MIDDHRGVVDEVEGGSRGGGGAKSRSKQKDKRDVGIDIDIKLAPRYPRNDQAGSWGGVGEVKLVSAGDGAADRGADAGSAMTLNRQ